MRIQVVYTGGTIGMVRTERGLAPGADVEGWLDRLVHGGGVWGESQAEAPAVSFCALEPLIDSSNATPASWQALVDALWQLRDAADAFLVLHGTDTMAHTSSALAFALSGCGGRFRAFGKPVVLTGSQLPLGEAGTDAAANVEGALRAASRLAAGAETGAGCAHVSQGGNGAATFNDGEAASPLSVGKTAVGCSESSEGQSSAAGGVYLYFGGRLLAGARATKASSWGFRAFVDPAGREVRNLLSGDAVGQTAPDGRSVFSADAQRPLPQPYRCCDVAVLTMVPGITAARVRAALDPAPEAVIVRGYGAGNVPADEPGLTEALASVAAAGAPVVVCSQCFQADVQLGRYETARALSDMGALGAGPMTFEACFAKTVFLLSQGLHGEPFGEAFDEPLAGER